MAIFGAVSDDALQFVIDHAEFKNFSENQFLFVEGDLANAMYVLITGKVTVFRDWEGERFPLREMGRGECVGEMSFLACSARSASVMAVEKVQVIEITNNLLADLYLSFPEQYTIIIMNMAREVCRRLEQADRRLFVLDRAASQPIQNARARNTPTTPTTQKAQKAQKSRSPAVV